MDLEFIKYEKDGRIAVVTINRPEVMNALHPACHDELSWIFDDFDADPDLWVGILTGAGDKAFSAGNDLKWTAKHGLIREVPRGGFGGMTARFEMSKPLVAAVNGFALGGGFELVLACDLVVAAEHAKFALPEPRVGMMAGAGGVHRLPQQIPLKVAMSYILTGRHMSVAEAHRLGIVNEVVPSADVLPAAKRWAEEVCECSPLAVRASKQAALGGLHLSTEEAMSTRWSGRRQLFRSEDVTEGSRAFVEKRKPRWTGKPKQPDTAGNN